MIFTKERKSEYKKHPIAGKESILPPEISAGQKCFSEKMTISFEKSKSENKNDTSETISSEEDSWKDPLGEISEGSSIEIFTVQKKHLRLSAPRELVTAPYQEEDDEGDEDIYGEAVGSSPLKEKVERNDKGKGKKAISRPLSRVRYSSPLAKFSTGEVEMTDSSLSASDKYFANRAPRPNTSLSLWLLSEPSKKLDHSGVKKQTQVSITPKESDGKLNNPCSRLQGPSGNSSAKKPILKNPAQSSSTSMEIDGDRPRLQSSSEAEHLESGAEHSSQSYVTGK
ncbi:hypothetical protein BY996DRAFT_6416970 [Phakopsora pachyrhizi]|nr:hypothetical protein BY996DRAFT_6416970 [Phakopsora pachyrhizi]